MDLEYVKPSEIEKRSFEIITAECVERGILISEEEAHVTKRVIHTTADFDYAKTLVYSENAVGIAEELLRNGADIVTDTNMALSGIKRRLLEKYGGTMHCYMAEPEVASLAREKGTTRASISMDKALDRTRPLIIAVGNAPTALIRLHELMQRGKRPDFIIGVPVGFVNVEAAKELILQSDIPHIVNRGRKGGSTVAAAICNALLYHMDKNTSSLS